MNTLSTSINTMCPCGAQHPEGYVCQKAAALLRATITAPCGCGGHGHEHTHELTAPEHDAHREGGSCCGHAHTHTGHQGHTHGTGESCCGHSHSAPQPLDPAALAALAAAGASSATRAMYRIINMDCPMEEALIRTKLGSMPGIVSLEFNLMQRVLTVNHDLPSTEGIEAALRSIDMTPEPLDLGAAVPAALPQPRIPWARLALAGVFAVLSEAFELLREWNVRLFGLDFGSEAAGLPLLDYAPLIFAVLAIGFGGLTTYRKGWIAVRTGNLNINALMSVAVTGAVCIQQYPEAAMVMVLFNISEAIEAKALDKARNAIKDLLALAPEQATVQHNGAWVIRDVREVPRGSRIRVRPGERVALDGVIVSGQSAINQAPITGESLPVEKTVGDSVYAGTINESGSFEFTTTAAATDSTLARIIHAVEEAQGSRAPMQRFVDSFARYYTPTVFLAALLTALIPPLLLGGAWAASVYTALVILVIGCPCALVISTPVSIVSGMAAATRYGILIKGGMYLEQGRSLQCLALDKTGTLTHGKPRQTDFVPLHTTGAGSSADAGSASAATAAQRLRTLAASLAARSDHPVSRAIAEQAVADNVPTRHVDGFRALPGQGVSGVMDGQLWHLGNYRMVQALGYGAPALEERMAALEKQGKTVVALVGQYPEQSPACRAEQQPTQQSVPCAVHALFAVADTLKDSSRTALRELKKLGVRTVMLTGDNEHTAAAIARQAGVDSYRGNLLPQDKLRVVEDLQGQGLRVGMVGDGINDAPALAKADVGFAMAGGGTDTAIETADVALMDDDLRKIPRFIGLSKGTYAILVQNITLALGVKALFFALTFMGMATMWMAVFADVGTALLVVGNGLRAMRL